MPECVFSVCMSLWSQIADLQKRPGHKMSRNDTEQLFSWAEPAGREGAAECPSLPDFPAILFQKGKELKKCCYPVI